MIGRAAGDRNQESRVFLAKCTTCGGKLGFRPVEQALDGLRYLINLLPHVCLHHLVLERYFSPSESSATKS